MYLIALLCERTEWTGKKEPLRQNIQTSKLSKNCTKGRENKYYKISEKEKKDENGSEPGQVIITKVREKKEEINCQEDVVTYSERVGNIFTNILCIIILVMTHWMFCARWWWW